MKSSRIQSNLIQQNCFVRDVVSATDLRTSSVDKVYGTLDEETTQNGVRFKISEQPYPITPQYVNSFVDSADYRRDPANAIANGVKRENLGDVRDVQNLSKVDTMSAQELYAALKAKLEAFEKSQVTPAPTPAPVNNNEVK